ncbi:MAG TPA: methylated-DNA--[protein]-cysteine S-methyltransferase [Acidimicrobiales bacterium]|nr:methylated-DNA--[protein]-cysteine S-methyltransferase [Acidimicrobiales bacterium]
MTARTITMSTAPATPALGARRDRPQPDGARPGPTSRSVLESPVGPLVLVGDEESLTLLLLPGVPEGPSARTPPGPPTEPVRRAAAQLTEYFDGSRTRFDLPLAPHGTPFQRSVWFALAEIPYGETISYGDLARRVGRPNAYRAVGQANGANPLPIILPCHRVVATGGGIGGYGGGLTLKRALLGLESGGAPG